MNRRLGSIVLNFQNNDDRNRSIDLEYNISSVGSAFVIGFELPLIIVIAIVVCVIIAVVAHAISRNKTVKKSMKATVSTMAQLLIGEEQQSRKICPYCGKPIIWDPFNQRFFCSFGCEREGKYF